MRWLALVALIGCGGDGPDGDVDATVADGPGEDGPPVNPLFNIGRVDLIETGYQFVEGPQWRESNGDLLFSDIPADTIYTYAGAVPTVFRAASGNSNGLTLDNDGVLIACEHGNRRISRGNGPTPVTLVDRFEGARLNSPNDVVVRDDGNLYFTDPPFGIQDDQRELAFMGTFRVAPDLTMTAIRRGALDERPNGIAISPEGLVLYVGDAAHGLVRAYDLAASGEASGERTFTTTAGTPDGMTVDVNGNLFVATEDGIEVFAPDGSRWGVIEVPEQPANAAFGGQDDRFLFITARTSLYRVRVAIPGVPRY